MSDATGPPEIALLKSRLWKLGLVYLLVAVPVLAAVYSGFGIQVMWMALVSAVACYGGATLAYICSEFPRGELFIQTRLMASSMVRAGIPLLLLVIAKLAFTKQFDLGMAYFVVLFYLVGLFTDLILQFRRNKPTNTGSKQILSNPVRGD